jgi:apolipoprotein N-acyltransferase
LGALAAAFLLGAASVLAFAPFEFTGLSWLTLAGLFLLWQRAASARAAARIGFLFGLGQFLAGVHWLYVAMAAYGGMPPVLAALAVLLFCAVLALLPAFAGWLTRRIDGSAAWRLLALAPAAYTLAEWLRGWLFTGFPWLAIGYSELPRGLLLGFAPVLGVYGLTLLAALCAGAIAWAIESAGALRGARVLRPLLLPAVLVAGALTLAQIEWSRPQGEEIKVSLLQGNIPQDLKFDAAEFDRTLRTYLRLARGSDARLMVLPESAIPALIDDTPPMFIELLEARARENGGDVLIGAFGQDPVDHAYHNSAYSFGSSPPQLYQKVHLVPFGESIPLKPLVGWLFERLLAIPIDDQGRGSPRQKPLAIAGQQVAVNICYEDAFGEEIIRQLPRATLLVNLTNDAWWGRSVASRQHNQIAQMRALETARPMLRATNTGVTSVIDHRGRVEATLPEFTDARLDALVQGREGRTPYVLWGNAATLLLVLSLLLSAWHFSRRSK